MKEELNKLSINSSTKDYSSTLIYSYLFFIEKIDNEELRKQFYSIIFSNEQKNTKKDEEKDIKKEIKYLQQVDIFLKIIEFIKIKQNDQFYKNEETQNIFNEFYSNEYSNIIDDISSHFYEVDEETIINMNSVILNDVLKSSKLKVETEEKLLHSLLQRRSFHLSKKQENENESDENFDDDDEDFFLESVQFEYLSVESISEFINEMAFNDLNEKIWLSICKRLVLPCEIKTKNERAKSQTKKIVQFPYQNDQKLNGILKHLSDLTNGNIHSNHTIEISCSYLCCGKYETLVDFNNPDGATHVNKSPSPRWLQIDFKTRKNRKVQINTYLIRTNSSNNKYFRSWNVEISNDGSQWEKIDEQNDVNELNGLNRFKSFNVEMTKPFRFIRFITDKPNFDDNDGFVLGKLEFFGNIISE